MASWRNSQGRGRLRDSQDIRKFIRVHGKIILPSIRTDSTEQGDGDDFCTPHTSSVVRPTKQLTLMHFNKKLSQSNSSKDKAQQEGGKTESASQQLFLPASKFSTGVRRKAREDETNKENRGTQESVSRMTAGQSPVRRVQHRSPSSVDKKRRERQQQPTSPPKQSGRNRGQKRSEVTTEPEEGGFLSSRKKTNKYNGHVSMEGLGQRAIVSATLIQPTVCEWSGMKPKVTKGSKAESSRAEVCLVHSVSDSESDTYINTDQLLEELSNCEKSLINAHRS